MLPQVIFDYTEPPVNLRFAWDSVTPRSVVDNETLFEVCFDVIGDCNTLPTTEFLFVDRQNSNIEITNQDAVEIGYQLFPGTVTVEGCAHTCAFESVVQPACSGDTGSIIVDVDADDTCTCKWLKDGAEIQSTPGNTNCNLVNSLAGNYTFQLIQDGAVVCTFDQSIVDPTPITTSPAITNAGCGNSGAITLNATGGTGILIYQWTPDVSTTDVAIDLPANDYTIVITDDNGCFITVMPTVTADLDVLVIDTDASTIIEPTCNGNSNGSIDVSVSGGCPPYTFAWDTGNGTGLSAGDYTVVVTDTNSETAEAIFTIGEPEAIVLQATITDANNGANGSILITPSGGTEPYTYVWSPNVSSSNIAMDLAQGFYDVTVTDTNGCTNFQMDIQVTDIGTGTELSIGTSTTGPVFGCNGECTGIITSSVIGGEAPFTVAISGPTSSSITQSMAGVFTIGDLCAGTYELTVTDANGRYSF